MTEEVSGRNVVTPQEIMAFGFVFGSCTAQTYMLTRTSGGQTGKLVWRGMMHGEILCLVPRWD